MEQLKSLLEGKVPAGAVAYCLQLWQQYPFNFTITGKRVSKLGDYRYDPRDRSHTITVNYDLNPYQFLITYVHEVAHRAVHQPRSRQKPHGPHWKSKFRELMLPLLNPIVYPNDILRVLARHMQNPKASTAGDPALVRVLAQYDPEGEQALTLADIGFGEQFIFRSRGFRKLEKKRTRSVCLDLVTNKKYLIPELAEVESYEKALERVESENDDQDFTLSRVRLGENFIFQNRTFKKLKKNRTRSICLDIETQQHYSIHERAKVERMAS